MGSLSIGYWIGGKVSEKRTDVVVLAWILLLAGFFMFTNAIGNEYVLKRIFKYIPDFRLKTLTGVIVLFGPASIFLGMVLPYAAKLVMNNIRTSGSATGNLYALSTTGSIVGTFLAGFVLVPAFGFTNVLFAITAILFLMAIIISLRVKKYIPALLSGIAGSVLIIFWVGVTNRQVDYIDTDTQYNRVLIYNTTDESTGRPVKILKVNDEKSSAMFTDNENDLVFEVLKYYRLVSHFNPGFRSSLMIGGSGYAFPKDYLNRFPEALMDVVEIDPGLTRLAKLHFNFPEDKRLNIYHEDGRTYVNRCEIKYDAVFMDAYKSMLTIPYQLTTREAVLKIYNILNESGAIYANIISSLNENNNHFLRAELATYKSVFPQVYLFAVQYPNPSDVEKDYFQNFLLVGLKSSEKPLFSNENEDLNKYLSHRYVFGEDFATDILTDEYAPVEFYANKALH
jgi:spermidine synthase